MALEEVEFLGRLWKAVGAVGLSIPRKNPTSPLGVGGLERFLFHPSLFPFVEGAFAPPPHPLDLDGGFREVSEVPF